MKIDYDKIADALYIYLVRGKINKTVKINDNLLVDVDKKGKVLGIEMLFVSSQMKVKDIEKELKKGIPTNIISGIPMMA